MDMTELKLSRRLSMVANLLHTGNVICDVGCDHGYLPIKLLQSGSYKRAIAMDINEGPLDIASSNISSYGLSELIETRLSDGVSALKPYEADAISICGMGGNVMMHIFEEGREVLRTADRIVLQPQSEYMKLYNQLLLEEYEILDEDVTLEDGKYYFAWLLRYASKTGMTGTEGSAKEPPDTAPEVSFYYSRRLIERRNELYSDYLNRSNEIVSKAIDSIEKNSPNNPRLKTLYREKSLLEETK